nr:hypothetical protein GCM10020063_050110 [Dactylosporangium thailandense]
MSDAPPSSSDRLPLRWAVIILATTYTATLASALVLLQQGAWPTALLTALGTAGISAPALHQVLAR